MNLDLIVDSRHSYRQAVEIAFEKAKKNGRVDEQTALECEIILSRPESDYVYHETRFDNTLRPSGDGGVFFRSMSTCEMYEQIRMDWRKKEASIQADDLRAKFEEQKRQLAENHPTLADKDFSFSVDEHGTITPVSGMDTFAPHERNLISEWLNENKEFKEMAKRYIWSLAVLVNRTLEGLNADYARYFQGSNPNKAHDVNPS
ncbi:hypothetical protein [Pseudomonas sp. SLFW]|uniref:hypothetical protein n=1 Tax=Pseudomonas sp. SLFW TaxID=2683259 RepID=UPI0014127660|nr:hypothetical protein [Pseudomonas sp. SLFW]NBB12463.1 hypothetical protein [Pseudomonas sp. SLFW]